MDDIYRRGVCLAAVVALTSACGSARGATPAKVDPAAVRRATSLAIEFLKGTLDDDGRCRSEFDAKHQLFGGRTALCAYALLTAGADQKDPTLRKTMTWLSKAKLRSVYAVSARAAAYAAWRDDAIKPLLEKDVQWLLAAAADDGSYTYGPAADARSGIYDNSNSQMAALAVWAAARRGIAVPKQYWQRVQRHWLDQQQPDGGWPYRTRRGKLRNKTYGSMTAAGLATLYLCFDQLRGGRFIGCDSTGDDRPIAAGLAWLQKHYSAERNPKIGVNRYYYWLYSLERVALAGGWKYFGSHDWYAEGAAALLSGQKDNGSWGYGGKIKNTAFALMFLARGRDSVLINKLQYNGKWNARPRDCANLTRWLGGQFERTVSWQVLGIEAPAGDLHDAPILYISGAGPAEFTDRQIARMRTFVLQGGTILSEAACNNGDFTLDMLAVYKKLFPAYKLRRLADNHPLYKGQFTPRGIQGLSAISNGIRLLAIHSPRELSLSLQLGPSKSQLPSFELMANLYLLATGRGVLRPRGANLWPEAKPFKPVATIRVARVRYGGAWDPEPLAWQRLTIQMGNRHRIRLEVSKPVFLTRLDASKYPVAVMTGTEEFTLSLAESIALRNYLADGGRLIVDAAGGAKTFAASARKQILPLTAGGLRGPVADNVLFGGPAPLRRVAYRRQYALALGRDAKRARLRGVLKDGRLQIVFSPDDLTAGLVGYPGYDVRGYTPKCSTALMTNLLCHLAGVKTPEPGQ